MKKLIILGIIIATLGLAGPKIIGSGVNQKIEAWVNAVNQTPGYRVQLINSETHWFSTLATVNVGLDPVLFGDMASDPAMDELFEDLSANLLVTIQHGPFLSLNGLSLGLLAAKADVSETLLRDHLIYNEDESLYSLAIDLSLFGNASYSDRIPEFKLRDMDTISFSGWHGSGSMSSSHYDYQGEMDSFTAALDTEKFEVTSMTLAMEAEGSLITVLSTPFYDSYVDFAIGSISVSNSATDDDIVSLKNFQISGTSDIGRDGQLMDVALSYGIEEMKAPGFNASDLLLKGQLNNLEKGFITALQKAGENPSALEQLGALFDGSILPQLKASPEFNITELSGKIYEGGFSGKMLTKLTGINDMPANMFDPGYWLSKLVIDSSLEMEKASALWLAKTIMASQLQSNDDMSSLMSNTEIESMAAQQAEATVNMLTTQGMILVNSKDNFEVTLSIKDGQVSLNGKPIPLPF